jgi:ATP-binding cassette subfamily F protein 3
MALATFHAPHLLILDEPTNHLDVDAREALARALNDYEGAVILISHDRHLIDACADRLWVVRGGTVRSYDGDMDTYRAECLAERAGEPVPVRGAGAGAGKGDGPPKLSPQEARRQAAEARAALAPLKRKVTAAEKEIETLSAKIAAIDASLADGTLYAKDAIRAQGLSRERGLLERARSDAEEAWLAASEAYEAAQTGAA